MSSRAGIERGEVGSGLEVASVNIPLQGGVREGDISVTRELRRERDSTNQTL